MADAVLSYPPHPFYPIEAKVAGYLANQWSVPVLLVVFFGGFAVILGTTLAIVTRVHPGLPKSDKAIILWFVLSKSHLRCDWESSANSPNSWKHPFLLRRYALAMQLCLQVLR